MRDTGFEMPLVGQRGTSAVRAVVRWAAGGGDADASCPRPIGITDRAWPASLRRSGLALGDRATWKWLENAGNPYRDEIDGVRRRLGRPGAVLLNMSYEWCCYGRRRPRPRRHRQPYVADARLADARARPCRRRCPAGRRRRPVLQRDVARLRRRADGNGAGPLQRRDQSAAIAPVHPLLLVRLVARPALDVATEWPAALALAAAGVRRVPQLPGCETDADRDAALPACLRSRAAAQRRAASSSGWKPRRWCTRRRSASPITGSASVVPVTTEATTASVVARACSGCWRAQATRSRGSRRRPSTDIRVSSSSPTPPGASCRCRAGRRTAPRRRCSLCRGGQWKMRPTECIGGSPGLYGASRRLS